MRVLVIGGTHFVGRHTVEVLLEAGHQVSVLNRGVSADPLPPTVQRLRADRTQRDEVLAALDGRSFDAVVDCPGYRPENLRIMIERFRGRVGCYVFISTCSAYAPSERLPIDESFPLWDDSPRDYPRNKVACERLLEAAGRDQGFPWVALRPAYIYGRYNNVPQAELALIGRIERGEPVRIPGDGSFFFHPCHARDLARAALAAIERKRASHRAYTINGAYAYTANGFVAALREAVGRDFPVEHAPAVTTRAEAASFFYFAGAPSAAYSIERARRELEWEPRSDLVAGLRDTYRWYVDSDYARRPTPARVSNAQPGGDLPTPYTD